MLTKGNILEIGDIVTQYLSLPFLNYSKCFRLILVEFLLQYFWLGHVFQKTYLAVVVGGNLARVVVALPTSTSWSVHLHSGVARYTEVVHLYSPPLENTLSRDYKDYSVQTARKQGKSIADKNHCSQFVDVQHTSQLDATSTHCITDK